VNVAVSYLAVTGGTRNPLALVAVGMVIALAASAIAVRVIRQLRRK
jgi:hypothetical protein